MSSGIRSRLLRVLLVCSLGLVLVAPAALAKGPRVSRLSASRIKKDLSGKGVVKVEVRKKGGGATWYPSEGRTLWEQTVLVHYKTPWKGVTEVHHGDVVYVWTGRGWKYEKVRPGGVWYEGFKNPSPAEIDAALAVAGQESVLDRFVQTYATQIHSVKLAADPRWSWSKPTEVSFYVTVVYDRKTSSSELAKVQQDIQISMGRAAVGSSYADFCKSDPDCIGGGGRSGQYKELSKTTVGVKRLNAMKSLHTIARERYIKPKYAALNAPAKWKDLTQFARYAYKALYTGDEKTWEAFVYFSGDESDKYDNGKQVFLDNKDAFRAQFCPELVITKKTGRPGADETYFFSDKGGKSECGINVQDFNGYRVKRVWCEFAVGDEAAQIAAVPAARGCVEKIKPTNPLGLEVGDEVMVAFEGGKQGRAVVKGLRVETVNVEYQSNWRTDWVPYERVTRAPPDTRSYNLPDKTHANSGKKPAPAARKPPASGPHPSGLAVGDKVMSKWHGNGREYPGTIKKLEGDRVFVRYDDNSHEWVPVSAVRKR